MQTISIMEKVTTYVDGVRSGAIPNPGRCNACKLYGKAEHDCIMCCHPPVTDPNTQPSWCPIRDARAHDCKITNRDKLISMFGKDVYRNMMDAGWWDKDYKAPKEGNE